jgi:hypothetical protein
MTGPSAGVGQQNISGAAPPAGMSSNAPDLPSRLVSSAEISGRDRLAVCLPAVPHLAALVILRGPSLSTIAPVGNCAKA